jgi:hypothetical protein
LVDSAAREQGKIGYRSQDTHTRGVLRVADPSTAQGRGTQQHVREYSPVRLVEGGRKYAVKRGGSFISQTKIECKKTRTDIINIS